MAGHTEARVWRCPGVAALIRTEPGAKVDRPVLARATPDTSPHRVATRVTLSPSLFESVRDGYGWQACPAPTDLNPGEIGGHEDLAQWAAGQLETWPARRRCRHSALLPASGIVSTEHRLIVGQMRTLFPEIEARRADLALWAEREGILTQARELDLANCETKQLRDALYRYAKMNYPDEVDRARRLEGARNSVAHRTLMRTSAADDMFGG